METLQKFDTFEKENKITESVLIYKKVSYDKRKVRKDIRKTDKLFQDKQMNLFLIFKIFVKPLGASGFGEES